MQIILDGLSIKNILGLIGVIMVIQTILNLRKLSPTGHFGYKYYLGISAVSWAGLLVVVGVTCMFWATFAPKSFSDGLYILVQLLSCLILADFLALCIAWLLKGQKSPFMKSWKQT